MDITYRTAFIASIATVALWTAKSVAIARAGGLDRSGLEGPLFLAGLVACVTAVVSLGLHLATGRPLWQRLATPVALVGLGVGAVPLLTGLVDALVPPAPGRHWAWYEVNLWVMALAVLAAVLLSRPRTEAARRPVRRAPVPSTGR